jgi:hypothetical protein
MKEREKVGFNDLKPGLKAIVVFMWIVAGLYIISFLIGLIIGLIEVV